jgi:hypothetical protein
MGNWAEVTVTDGRFEVTNFGRSDDLDDAGDPATRRFTTSDAAGDLGLDDHRPGGAVHRCQWIRPGVHP